MLSFMTPVTQMQACIEFFNQLSEILVKSGAYEVIKSCNQDLSAYLIPKGTISDLSYSNKPAKSFRVSDHWNWYSNLKKNPDPHYIQCYSVDLPRAKKRNEPGKASTPIQAAQVGYFDEDNKYHAVFGEIFDRKTKTWDWLEADPEDVLNWLGLIPA